MCVGIFKIFLPKIWWKHCRFLLEMLLVYEKSDHNAIFFAEKLPKIVIITSTPFPDMERMKNGAILVNMGHSNTEIDVARYINSQCYNFMKKIGKIFAVF
jgi:hypothetical protein